MLIFAVTLNKEVILNFVLFCGLFIVTFPSLGRIVSKVIFAYVVPETRLVLNMP